MRNEQILAEIRALKSLLADTDYVGIKIGEGEATRAEYTEVLQKRHAWRTRINQLEDMLTGDDDG